MKTLVFSKIACGVVIGALVPLSAVQASSDDANDRIQAFIGESASTQTGKSDAWSTPQGAQGPIRSDMTDDKATQDERAAKRLEMEKQLYPLNAQGA